MRNILLQTQPVQDGVFRRIFVIRLPSAGLLETRFFIKTSRRSVRLANFQKHRPAVCCAGRCQQGLQKLLSKPLTACRGRDDQVFQLPFGGEMPGHDEAENIRA